MRGPHKTKPKDRNYEVGRGKPPKEHQFSLGTSGNPAGPSGAPAHRSAGKPAHSAPRKPATGPAKPSSPRPSAPRKPSGPKGRG